MIGIILKVATYTYGPLLGLFSFAILSRRRLLNQWVPLVCIISPILCFLLDKYQEYIFGSFHIGLELLLFNGIFTFLGLLIISSKPFGNK
jgi:hypothetical protein